MPTDTCAHQETIVCRNEFQDLAEFRIHALGGKPHSLIEKFQKWLSLQCHDAQLSEDFLLTNSLSKCARSRISGRWTWFHHRLRVISCVTWACHRGRDSNRNPGLAKWGSMAILHSSNSAKPMSALGQKQTFTDVRRMSALPPIADIGTQPPDVCFVPKADIGTQN